MPQPPATPSDDTDKPATSESFEQAKADQGHCVNCGLAGNLTIFRKRTVDRDGNETCEGYRGDPMCELIDHNGEVKLVRARIGCHCACLVGQWMRDNTDAKTCLRIPSLRIVGIKGYGMENWTQHDPTIPEATREERQSPPDWAAFRKQLAAIHGSPIQVVKREPSQRHPGVPAEVKRELEWSEPKAARSNRSAVVPDDYGPPVQREPATVPADDFDEVPF